MVIVSNIVSRCYDATYTSLYLVDRRLFDGLQALEKMKNLL